jgi:hypothetical protein
MQEGLVASIFSCTPRNLSHINLKQASLSQHCPISCTLVVRVIAEAELKAEANPVRLDRIEQYCILCNNHSCSFRTSLRGLEVLHALAARNHDGDCIGGSQLNISAHWFQGDQFYGCVPKSVIIKEGPRFVIRRRAHTREVAKAATQEDQTRSKQNQNPHYSTNDIAGAATFFASIFFGAAAGLA